jgi:ADP-ribose pyrophosphatase
MTDLSWETLESTVAYTCDGFDIVNEQVRLPDGTTAEFDYLSETESVVILPFTGSGEDTDNEVVVIEEWRQAVRRVNRGLPAGTMESGEEPATAVRRELREETGYEAGEIEHLTTVEPANGYADSVFHYYAAYDCEPTGSQQLDADESIEVTTASFPELLDTVESGDLRDGRSTQGILHYALFEQPSSPHQTS